MKEDGGILMRLRNIFDLAWRGAGKVDVEELKMMLNQMRGEMLENNVYDINPSRAFRRPGTPD
ncbi:MAG: hypothetical protein ACUVTM_04985 [Candidatus Bathyarchaeia archaeon]